MLVSTGWIRDLQIPVPTDAIGRRYRPHREVDNAPFVRDEPKQKSERPG